MATFRELLAIYFTFDGGRQRMARRCAVHTPVEVPLSTITATAVVSATAQQCKVCVTRPSQSATSNAAMTLVGVIRTTSSPGTPLRRPNSSARSWPMYRAAIRVAVSRRSVSFALIEAMP
ncbi:hypothetical protein ABIA65_002054 [Mycolicibacterium sp. 624]